MSLIIHFDHDHHKHRLDNKEVNVISTAVKMTCLKIEQGNFVIHSICLVFVTMNVVCLISQIIISKFFKDFLVKPLKIYYILKYIGQVYFVSSIV